MVHKVIYPLNGSRLAILTLREHLCGFYQNCPEGAQRVDPKTGHRVCCACERITVSSGLRRCDICDNEYIDKNNFQDPRYDTNCPRCVKDYGLDV